MPAAAERAVDIDSAFADVQHIDGFLEHDAQVPKLLAFLRGHLAIHLLGLVFK